MPREPWLAAGPVSAELVSTVDIGGAASAGRRTVKIDPLPGALVTVTSPPINRHSLGLIARPSPVPPNWRVIEASAGKFLEQPADLLLGHADTGVGEGEIDPILTVLF